MDSSRTIVICEYISTGINYVYDAWARGYEPVLVEAPYDTMGRPEDMMHFRAERERINRRLNGRVRIIKEDPDYDVILRQVRELDPALVVAGSEFGVPMATMLSADLGLPGNPVESIAAMTEKDAMQLALRRHGIRNIRGGIVTSEDEALELFRSFGKAGAVVKPARGAGSQGVYICGSEEELLDAVRTHFLQSAERGLSLPSTLVQERINGTEYVVNTVSCGGRHRVVSVGTYDKYRLSNGSNAYNYFRYVSSFSTGHSRLLQYACQVADAIGIQYGPVHGEYMIDEDGPVLIEVNCRPMGGGLDRKYSEMVTGQHETDSALDSYLDPDKFLEDARKPYRLRMYGASKDLILTKDTVVDSAPVLQICRRLKSYYSASFGQIGMTGMLPQTTDMETEAGLVYLLHESEKQVMDDCRLLHLLEIKYPAILYHDASAVPTPSRKVKRDIEGVMEAAGCRGATIILSDSSFETEGAAVVGGDELMKAYDSYEQGIIDLSDPASFADLESAVQQIFTLFDKVREGGRVLVPESTYCNLPYGIEGMEILFRAAGLVIELPTAGAPGLLCATVQRQS